jgi:hypothetical protein
MIDMIAPNPQDEVHDAGEALAELAQPLSDLAWAVDVLVADDNFADRN